MYFLNELDELGRYRGLKVYDGRNGQGNTHGYSYLYARNELKKLGRTMGLDKIILKELCEKK